MASVFAQTQSIVTRIRHILEEYKYGAHGDTVLLELLQNSDDAGATAVRVILEVEAATAAGQSGSPLARHPVARTPALMFFNSSTFTDRDLQNIQYIGGLEANSKRHEATKVGRFGVGFNSSYHVADVVCFVSGENIVVFDPMQQSLPRKDAEGKGVGGLRWNFLHDLDRCDAAERDFVEGLLTAFENSGVGFDRKAFFNGTLFRFALRETPSELWRELHTPAELLGLLRHFRHTATLGLVLLKNVREISAAVRVVSFAAEDAPSVDELELYSVHAHPESAARQDEARAEYLAWLSAYTRVMEVASKAQCASKPPDTLPQPKHMRLEIVIEGLTRRAYDTLQVDDAGFAVVGELATADIKDGVEVNGVVSSKRDSFRVNHFFGPGAGWADSRCWQLADECARYRHPISVPWAASIVQNDAPCPDARLICFFPIRQGSGLPMHLHGYVELSSDRQSIKGLETSAWNRTMCEEVIPYAYKHAVLELCELDAARLYDLWPVQALSDPIPALIAARTLRLLSGESVFRSASGRFHRLGDVTFAPTSFDCPLLDTVARCAPDTIALAKSATEDTAVDEMAKDSLDALVAALLREEIELRVADSDALRKILAASSASTAVAIRAASREVALQLFCELTNDDNLKEFARLAIPAFPMDDDDVRAAAPSTKLLSCASDLQVHLARQCPFSRSLAFYCRDPLASDLFRKADAKVTAMASDGLLKSMTNQHLAMLIEAEISHPTWVKRRSAEVEADAAARWVLKLRNGPQSIGSAEAEVDGELLFDFVRASKTFDMTIVPVALFAQNEADFDVEIEAVNAARESVIAVNPEALASCRDFAAVVETCVCLGAKVAVWEIFSGVVERYCGVDVISPDDPVGSLEVIVKIANLGDYHRKTLTARRLRDFIAGSGEVRGELFRYFASAPSGCFNKKQLEFIRGLAIIPFLRCPGATNVADVDIGVPSAFTLDETSAARIAHSDEVGELLAMVRMALADPLQIAENAEQYSDRLEFMDAMRASCVSVDLLRAVAMVAASAPTSATSTMPLDAEWCALLDGVPGVVAAECKAPDTQSGRLWAAAREALSKKRFLPIFVDGSDAVSEWVAPTSVLASTDDPLVVNTVASLTELLRGHHEAANLLDGLPRLVRGLAPTQQRALVLLGACDGLDNANHVVAVAKAVAFAAKVKLFATHESHCSAAVVVLRAAHSANALDALFRSDIAFIPAYVCSMPSCTVEATTATARRCTLLRNFRLSPTWKALVDPAIEEEMASSGSMRDVAAALEWETAPPVSATVDFLNACGAADHETLQAHAAELLSGMHAAYQAIEARYKSWRKGPAGVQRHVDPWDSAASFDDETLSALGRLKFLYLPEKITVMPISRLCTNQNAGCLAPHLAAVDALLLREMPHLIRALRIPESHDAAKIVAVINEMSAPFKVGSGVPCDDATRASLCVALNYLVSVVPQADLRREHRSLLVPTRDGFVNEAHLVAYDLGLAADARLTADLLHPAVPSSVPSALGMLHSSARFQKKLAQRSWRPRGQRESLTNALRRILNDYNRPSSIFSEMLQNADDAGAKTVRITLDTRSFAREPATSLLGEGMVRCQGPALCIANDVVFTRNDVDSLMEVACGNKRQDSTTIGRFGVGFCSAYHVTDCPMVVSDETLIVLDPTVAHLRDATHAEPGLQVTFTEHPEMRDVFPLQFEPFQAFGIDFTKPFKGTLIRLPIRTAALPVGTEHISTRKWDVSEVRALVAEFVKELPRMLLFLNHVTSVEVSEIGDSGEHFFGSSATICGEGLEGYRKEVRDFIVAWKSGGGVPKLFLRTSTTVAVHTKGPTKTREYLLATVVDSRVAMPSDVKVGNTDLLTKLIPSASCALRIGEVDGTSGPARGLLPEIGCSLHCFLPLPGSSDLPFHLHGCFALSSDRKGMFLSSEGEVASKTWEATWNDLILRKVAPRTLAFAIEQAATTMYLRPRAPPTASEGNEQRNGSGGARSLPAIDTLFDVWPVLETDQSRPVKEGFLRLILRSTTLCLTVSLERDVLVHVTKARLVTGTYELGLSASNVRAIFSDDLLAQVPPTARDMLVSEAMKLEVPLLLPTPRDAIAALQTRAGASSGLSIPFHVVFGDDGASALDRSNRALNVAKALAPHLSLTDRVPLVLLADGSLGVVWRNNNTFVASKSSNQLVELFPHAAACVVDSHFDKELKISEELRQKLGIMHFDPSKNLGAMCRAFIDAFIPPRSHGTRIPFTRDYEVKGTVAHFIKQFWNVTPPLKAAVQQALGPSSRRDKDVDLDKELLLGLPLIPAIVNDTPTLVPIIEVGLIFSHRAFGYHGAGVSTATLDALRPLGVGIIDATFPNMAELLAAIPLPTLEPSRLTPTLTRPDCLRIVNSIDGPARNALRKALSEIAGVHEHRVPDTQKVRNEYNIAVRKLPIFHIMSSRGKFVFDVAGLECVAIPADCPPSAILEGMARNADPAFDLRQATPSEVMARFFANVARFHSDEPVSTVVELRYFDYFAENLDSSTVKEELKRHNASPFIPSVSKFTCAPVHLRPEDCKLKVALLRFVAETSIPTTRLDGKYDHLREMIDKWRLRGVDRASRIPAKDARMLLNIRSASVPNVVQLLAPNVNAVPTVLVENKNFSNFLYAMGVRETITASDLIAAAQALKTYVTNERKFNADASRIRVAIKGPLAPAPSGDLLREMSISLMAAISLFTKMCKKEDVKRVLDAISDMAIVATDNTAVYPGIEDSTRHPFCALDSSCAFNERHLAYTVLHVMHPKIDRAPFVPTVQYVTTEVVVKHLRKLAAWVNDGSDETASAPETAASLKRCYMFLIDKRRAHPDALSTATLNVDLEQIFACKVAEGATWSAVPIVMISAREVLDSRGVSLAPYFFTRKDLTEEAEQLLSYATVVATPSLPQIINALLRFQDDHEGALAPTAARLVSEGDEQQNAVPTPTPLSAGALDICHGLFNVLDRALEDARARREAAGGGELDPAKLAADADFARIMIPTTQGYLAAQSAAIFPDNEKLLRRIDPASMPVVHRRFVPIVRRTFTNIAKLSATLVEHIEELPEAESAPSCAVEAAVDEQAKKDAETVAIKKLDAARVALDEWVVAANTFLCSSTFGELMAYFHAIFAADMAGRAENGEALDESELQSLLSGVRVSVSPTLMASLQRSRGAVADMVPSSRAEVATAISRERRCVQLNRRMILANAAVDPALLVAREINNLFDGIVSDVPALICALQVATRSEEGATVAPAGGRVFPQVRSAMALFGIALSVS